MKHWQTSENKFLDTVENDYDVAYYLAGDDDFVYDKESETISKEEAQSQLKFGEIKEKDKKDQELAKKGMEMAFTFLEEKPFLLVLDELNVALKFKLIEEKDVEQLIKKAKEQETHLVITGRSLPSLIKEHSDLITEMKKEKHPFDKGEYAIKGLDY